MKRLRRPGDRGAVRLAALPESLLHAHVFSFVAAPPLLSAETFDVEPYKSQLAPLRGVSRQWNALAESLWAQAQGLTHTLTVEGDDEHGHEAFPLVGGGSHVQFLSVVLGVCQVPSSGPVICVPSTQLDGSAFDVSSWTSRLAPFQRVVRLDLSLVPFSFVGDVLVAAADVCVHVKALVLPFSPSLDERSQDGYGTHETESLVTALRSWHQRHGGLRLLHVPYWPAHHHTQLLEAIVAYCSQIQYLRGWHLQSGSREVTALGACDRFLWYEFCRVCTELREFDWRQAPMWGTNVDAFRATPKPFLREMVIKETRGRANIDYALKSVQSIAEATPRLRRLRVQLQDRMFFLIAENHAAFDDLTTTIADAFVKDLVAQCPRLEQFHYRMRSPDRELTVTDHALTTLLAVPSIEDIAMTRVVVTPTSLVDVVRSCRKKQRRLSVHLTAADAAHESIAALLDYLANTDHARELEGVQLSLTVAREDMVRATYPRGIPVKTLLGETELQQRLTALEAHLATTTTRFHLALEVFCFGVETQRHAVCEMKLRIHGGGAGMAREERTQDEGCHITRTQVPRYRRKAGRLA